MLEADWRASSASTPKYCSYRPKVSTTSTLLRSYHFDNCLAIAPSVDRAYTSKRIQTAPVIVDIIYPLLSSLSGSCKGEVALRMTAYWYIS